MIETDFPDLKQLGVYLKIIDENGIGRAARSLGVSQPYVSQELRRLESKLGHRLIERDGRNIQLTADGEALRIFARSMAAVAERTLDYFSTTQFKGLIRIGLTEEIVGLGLTRVLGLFMSSHPGFRIEVETSYDSVGLQRGALEGRFDLVVGKIFGAAVPGHMLWREPIVWYGRPGGDKPIEDPVQVVLAPASELRTIVIDRLNESGRTWTIAFQSPNFFCLEVAVRAGFGVGPAMKSLDRMTECRILTETGLPRLPDATYFTSRREGVNGAEEFESVLREVLFQTYNQKAAD